MRGIIVFLTLFLLGCSQSQNSLLLDSFEGEVSHKTFDYGSSKNSSVKIEAEKKKKLCGRQSLKITYTLKPSGYMWIARGYNLDVKGAGWGNNIEPKTIKWDKYNSFSLAVYGKKTNRTLALDIKDKGGEIWRYLIDDDFSGWKTIIIKFSDFFPRKDWQPSSAVVNETLDFPIMSFQFEPLTPGKGDYLIDCVKLTYKNK